MSLKPTINDFVERRWADAKGELQKLDPDFVRRSEETVRLQGLGLEALDFSHNPKRRLSREWHILLEDCDELVRKASVLQTAIDCFIADSGGGMSSGDIGRRFFYHMQSWFIHAQALAEYTQRVFSSTTKLYFRDSETGKKIANRHIESVRCQVTRWVEQGRIKFVHATGKSLSTGITEDDLWEGSVAAGLTPQISHDEFTDPIMGEQVKSGKYRLLADANGTVLERTGRILQELEEDIAIQKVQADP